MHCNLVHFSLGELIADAKIIHNEQVNVTRENKCIGPLEYLENAEWSLERMRIEACGREWECEFATNS